MKLLPGNNPELLLTVQCIPDQDFRVMDDVGFRIPRVGFRIPGTGFWIPKPWIPDSNGKKMLDSGFRIPLHGAISYFQAIALSSCSSCVCSLSCVEHASLSLASLLVLR